METDPQYQLLIETNKLEYRRFLDRQETLRATGCAGEARRVPIVVHVLHLGEPIGTGFNISDAQIMGAINGLNGRWTGQMGDGADMGFEFCLARRNPQGLPTTGIVRMDGRIVPGYETGGMAYGGGPGADEAALKALSTWPQSQYYNVWVVSSIGSGGIGGFAYFPNGGPLDGTVILASGMTSGSTTLTHELGHGFNLFHTFQGDNDGANCPPDNDCIMDGDRVCDTPPHKVGDCGISNPCSGGGDWDNSRRNIMSYCGGTTRLTSGQGVRVNAAAYGTARLPLFRSEGCIPADQALETGILRIISPDNQPLCEDTFTPRIEVKNYGTATITALSIEAWVDGALYNTTSWTGSIPTNTTREITLEPITVGLGGHDIDYRIVDNNGAGGDSYTDNNQLCTYLYYEPFVTDIPTCWDFEGGQRPESWTVNGPLITVQPYQNPGCTNQGSHCLVFNAFNAGAGGNGTRTIMTVVPFDLSGLPGAALNFDVAMRKNYYADHTSTLEVLVSTDCGANYTPVYHRRDTYSGMTEDLHTVPAPADLPTSSWVPTQCSHWRRDIADLSAFAGQEVLVAFRFTIDRGFGENLYLDNICVQSCEGFAELSAVNGPGVCFPDTARFALNTGPGFTYKWFQNGRPIPGANQPAFWTTTPGFYSGVIEVDGCRFATPDTLEMLYFPFAVVNIIGNVAICAGDTAFMDAGAGFVSYLWDTGDTTQIIGVTAPGTYFVTVTNQYGCTGMDWTQVSTKVTPNAVINGVLNFCEGGGTTLNVSPFFNNVLWNTGETGTSIQVSATGTYSVTVTGSNGCFDVDQVEVTERIPDPPQISGVLAICSGEQTTLDAGAGYNTYKWSSGPTTRTINVSTAGTYSVTVTDAFGCSTQGSVTVTENVKPQPVLTGLTTFCTGAINLLDAGPGFAAWLWSTGETTQTIEVLISGTYQVTVTSAAGCTGTAQLNVTALPAPNPQITGNLEFCEGGSTTLNAGNNFFSYEWSTGTSGQTLVVSTSATYTVTVTNSIGCPGTASVEVIVHPFPQPDISGVPAICQGEQTILDAGAGFATYQWSTGGSAQTLVVTSGGTYSVTVTSTQGCSGTASRVVTESANPQPQISGATQLCAGEQTTLDAGAGFATWLWSGGQSTPTIVAAASGTYQVTVTNVAGCSGTTQHTLVVHPLPSVGITGQASFCQGGSTLLQATPGQSAYLWNTGDTAAQLSVSQAGTYRVTVTDGNGCTGTADFQVSVLSLVNPQVLSIPASACPGATLQLQASGGTDYLWIEGASLLSDPTIPNPTITPTQSLTLSVEISNACNAEVVSIDITVREPQGMAGPDLNVLQGREVSLSASGGVNYLWAGPSALTCTQCPEPRTTPTASGHYYVTITDLFGCVTVDSIFVEVFDDLDQVLELVNTITPNGDGFNDLLIIKGLESFDANSLTIYNRWGEQVFHQDNYQNNFGGRYRGKLLPSGSYYYVLRLWPGDRTVKSVLVILHEED
jgi:gliding motility-associated-like protein